MESQLDIRVIDHPLENLAIHFKKSGAPWFGLLQCYADRLLKQIRLDRALDSHEYAKLPFRTGVTRFLRKPYAELSARQRMYEVIKLHANSPKTTRLSSQKSDPLPAYKYRIGHMCTTAMTVEPWLASCRGDPGGGCLMADKLVLPLGISLSRDVEVRPDRATPLRARVRWVDPVDKKRCSTPY